MYAEKFISAAIGLNLVKLLFTPGIEDNLKKITEIVTGEYTEAIKDYLREYEMLRTGEDTADEDIVDRQYYRLVRHAQLLLDEHQATKKQSDRFAKHTERIMRMRALSATHPAGTTQEIALLLGVSKSKVRQLKTTGELDTMIELARLGKENIES